MYFSLSDLIHSIQQVLGSSTSPELTLVQTAITKKSTNTKCWRGCGENGALLYCCCECKLI